MGQLFTKKWKFLIFWAAFPPPVAIEVKFCRAKWTQVTVGPAKFDVNLFNESPMRGEKPDFWPVSKFNTGSLPLCGILSVINEFCGRLIQCRMLWKMSILVVANVA